MKKYKKTLSVIGLGYIGLPFLLCLTKSKYNLIGVDKNLVKLNSLKNKSSSVRNILSHVFNKDNVVPKFEPLPDNIST